MWTIFFVQIVGRRLALVAIHRKLTKILQDNVTYLGEQPQNWHGKRENDRRLRAQVMAVFGRNFSNLQIDTLFPGFRFSIIRSAGRPVRYLNYNIDGIWLRPFLFGFWNSTQLASRRFHFLVSRYTNYPHLWIIFHFQVSRYNNYPHLWNIFHSLASLFRIYLHLWT